MNSGDGSVSYTVDSHVTDTAQAGFVSEQAAADAANKKTPLSQTVRYMRTALLGPLVLSVLSGLPLLLLSSFSLLRKTGQYIVILSIVSYVVACTLLPFACSVSCETPFMKWLRQWCCAPLDELSDNHTNSTTDFDNSSGFHTSLLDECRGEDEVSQPEESNLNEAEEKRSPVVEYVEMLWNQILQGTNAKTVNSSTKNNYYDPEQFSSILVVNESGSPLLEEEED